MASQRHGFAGQNRKVDTPSSRHLGEANGESGAKSGQATEIDLLRPIAHYTSDVCSYILATNLRAQRGKMS